MFDIAPEPFDSESSAAMSSAYYDELAARLPRGFSPDAAMAASAENFAPPRGVFLVMRVAGVASGCGGVRELDRDTAEIKHMWIAPDQRGSGFGKKMLSALEGAAREMGYKRVVLDTSRHLPEAIALYNRAGYVEIESYNENRYAEAWFERDLEDDSEAHA